MFHLLALTGKQTNLNTNKKHTFMVWGFDYEGDSCEKGWAEGTGLLKG